MFTLSIYNKLTQDDITNCKKIVGAGTIDENRLMHSFVREIRDNKLGAITWEII